MWVSGCAFNLHKFLKQLSVPGSGALAPSADFGASPGPWSVAAVPDLALPRAFLLQGLAAPFPPVILAPGCPAPKADGVE